MVERQIRRFEDQNRVRGRFLKQICPRSALAVGVAPHGGRSNGLALVAGTWSSEEHDAFEHAVAETEQIDEDLWR